jgi:hypothetical protein
MKNTPFSFFLFVWISFVSFRVEIKAQSSIWVQNNAVWHYDFDYLNGSFGFIKTEHVGDTMLYGHQSKVFSSTRYRFFTDQNQIVHLSTITPLADQYTWNNDHQVYYLVDQQYELLYDFTKNPGENYPIVTYEDPVDFCNPISSTSVISTGSMQIGNESYPTMELQSSLSNLTQLNGSVNARYGNHNTTYSARAWLFPMKGGYFPGVGAPVSSCDTTLLFEWTYLRFRCFQDDSLTVNPNNVDCEYYINHVGMPELNENGYLLYPNPAADFITLVSPFEQNDVQIFTISGSLVYSGKSTAKIQELDLNLPKGTYILKVSSENQLRYTEKLVIQ